MNVSYQWLSQYIDLEGYTAAELAELLTRSGVEVESVTSRNAGVSGVVVGHVVARDKHPNADKLSVCQVDVGQAERLQIVCGAANVAAGQNVPVATVGAVLPGDFKIKRAKLRDVESHGMICSAKELGLNEKMLPKEQQEGILVLPADAPLGTIITEYFGLEDDILELSLTPNRSDCLSLIGVAYEIGAIIGRPVRLPEAASELERFTNAELRNDFHVTIDAAEACSLYTGRLIEGVTIAPSPQWLQNRLLAAGIRPINNVVDVTNFVLLEYGQPLHAFDRDKLQGAIRVRFAAEGEPLETLDGQTRTLHSSMLVIADGDRPVALAGVMGGANSEVSQSTTRILLESAKFAGGIVRKTSRQLGLRSESSLRFEKEVNPDAVPAALDRAAALIAQLAGGQVASGIESARTEEFVNAQVSVSLAKINGYLGTSLTREQVEGIFTRLQFAAKFVDATETFTVDVPKRRGDIIIDVDLIEEIARLYGYDQIPTSLVFGPTTVGALSREQAIRREVRRRLVGFGLDEVINYTFTHSDRASSVPGFYEGKPAVALSLPMHEERSTLRQSLVPHLLEMAAYNRNLHQNDLAIFELGQVFITDEYELTRLPHEPLHLGVLLTGKRQSEQWNQIAQAVDFYDLKGILERLFTALGVSDIRYQAKSATGYHPGRTAEISVVRDGESRVLGILGQIHPETQQQLELADTYVAELDLDVLISLAVAQIAYQPIGKYPESRRDLALVVDRQLESARLFDTIRQAGGELLQSVQIFDVYTGERIESDKKSVAFSLVFRHAERTLQDEEVQSAVDSILKQLEETCSARLRK